ncbi:MAG: ATP-binding protein [Patescibacteria group bacterium]|nr:ATP-binding protein [Patescibacteria group bacterium]
MLILTPKLLILVIATLVNLVLLAVIYRQNPRSATHRLFAALNLIVTFWLIASYLSTTPQTDLLWARFTIFFATLMTALLFLFSHTLPKETVGLGKGKMGVVVISTLLVMGITLSPYAFSGIDTSSATPQLIVGFGMGIFGALATFFSALSMYVLWKKFKNAEGVEKEQVRYVFWGATVMLGLLILTVLIPVLVWQMDFFAGLIPLYSLIFLGMTAYAIVRYHLFNLKVIATEAVTAVLWIVLLSRIVVAETLNERITDGFIFVLAFLFGIILVKSVRQEVQQREELERLTKELEEANTKLSELNRFKTQLLSLASHQIKSPLAAIKGFISLLLEGLYGPVSKEVKDTLEKVKKSADALVCLINTLLDLRKAEEGKMDYQFAIVDFGAMVKNVYEGLMPLATQKKIEFTLAPSSSPIFVEADIQKLAQVIQNITDNAIKYTPFGFVKLTVRGENNMAVCEVSDSGLGMSPEFTPHVFDEFMRDERIKAQIKGTGLGLYIAKKIVEAHHGVLEAHSEGEGRGSLFVVRLPKTK